MIDDHNDVNEEPYEEKKLSDKRIGSSGISSKGSDNLESFEAEITVDRIRGNKSKELNKVRIAASNSDLFETFMPFGVS